MYLPPRPWGTWTGNDWAGSQHQADKGGGSNPPSSPAGKGGTPFPAQWHGQTDLRPGKKGRAGKYCPPKSAKSAIQIFGAKHQNENCDLLGVPGTPGLFRTTPAGGGSKPPPPPGPGTGVGEPSPLEHPPYIEPSLGANLRGQGCTVGIFADQCANNPRSQKLEHQGCMFRTKAKRAKDKGGGVKSPRGTKRQGGRYDHRSEKRHHFVASNSTSSAQVPQQKKIQCSKNVSFGARGDFIQFIHQASGIGHRAVEEPHHNVGWFDDLAAALEFGQHTPQGQHRLFH